MVRPARHVHRPDALAWRRLDRSLVCKWRSLYKRCVTAVRDFYPKSGTRPSRVCVNGALNDTTVRDGDTRDHASSFPTHPHCRRGQSTRSPSGSASPVRVAPVHAVPSAVLVRHTLRVDTTVAPIVLMMWTALLQVEDAWCSLASASPSSCHPESR